MEVKQVHISPLDIDVHVVCSSDLRSLPREVTVRHMISCSNYIITQYNCSREHTQHGTIEHAT
jgi:hypothetical protein